MFNIEKSNKKKHWSLIDVQGELSTGLRDVTKKL